MISNPASPLAQFSLLFMVMCCGMACGKPASPTAKAVAKCLQEKGAKMYGAFWCPHCAAQKELFGDAFPATVYIECSNEDRSQTAECEAANITGYPTWEFADASRAKGEQTLSELSQKAGCTGE